MAGVSKILLGIAFSACLLASFACQSCRKVENTDHSFADLTKACNVGQLSDVKRLLDDNPGLVSVRDSKGETALFTATLFGREDIVDLLIAKKADVNARNKFGQTPLHAAASSGHVEAAEVLLANHAEVNARTSKEETPLMTAAQADHPRLAGLLISHGADVNAKRNDGLSALAFTGFGITPKTAILLLNAKADPNGRLPGGYTLLHTAAFRGQPELIKSLVAHGADVNATVSGKWPIPPSANPGKWGSPLVGNETSLHIAVCMGRKEIVLLLLGLGADATFVNAKGETPYQLAKKIHNGEIASLLRRHR